MSQAQRLAYIHRWINGGELLTTKALQEQFEISRSTAMRDIEYCRDRLGAPIVYDARQRGYRLRTDAKKDSSNSFPGLWLSPKQAYALLTLYNVVRSFDPGALEGYLNPFRDLIKGFIVRAGLRMRGFDEKIRIEIPFDPPIESFQLASLSHALANDTPITARVLLPNGQTAESRYLVKALALRLDGWWAELAHVDDAQQILEVNASNITLGHSMNQLI